MQETNQQNTIIEIKKQINTKKVRKHGFQPPFSKHQIATVTFFIFQSVFNLKFIFFSQQFIQVQVIWLAVIILNHFAWGLYGYKVTINNPTDPSVLKGNMHKGKGMIWCVVCQGYAQEKSKHCSQCNRCTEVFDHHCVWINNCIGRRNYNYFINFTVSYFLMEIQWTTLNVTYMLTQNAGWSVQNFVFIADIINLLLSVVIAIFTGNQLIFHIWLTKYKKITTFEYLQQKQNKQNQKSSVYEEEKKKINDTQNKQETSNISNQDQKTVQSIQTQNYETKGLTYNTSENQSEIKKVSASKKFIKLKSIEEQTKSTWETKFKEINQLKNANMINQKLNQKDQMQKSLQQFDISKVENSKIDENPKKINSDQNEGPNLSTYGLDQSQIQLQQNKSSNKKQLPSFGNLENFQKSQENIDQQLQDGLHSKVRIFQVQEEKELDNISTSVVQSQIDEKNEDQFQSSWFQNSNSLTASSIQNYYLQKILEKNNLQLLPNKKQNRLLKNQKQLLTSSEQTQSSKIISEKRITFGVFKQGEQHFDEEQENNVNYLNEGGQNELSFNLNENNNELNL
ncbi:DHHC zinc finger protein (macronuclear) [Tetrahymena thermophila SB210]|uniref:Palmitoyltransferase n=1 Tax=Tetrahymena thermophila (strain SB210) TaxID=312017 RepID=I7MKM0_TETTS|nr:DHHC zinc finger protein [Tetrahymena thermophila SB210]EAR99537.2 DHHC zinc finger protein [Tetrahymena thermophila SB210]|eukprot:XP_001019782.2 DHHC zinc finger protein [Tetrahymena thermophila SB210]